MKNYYTILEVPPTASQQTIREQYLFLIQAWHPDKFSNPTQKARAEEKCKEINAAYDVLKDIQKRSKYDLEISGKPSPFGEQDRSRQAEEQRQRKQAEEARRRQQAQEAKRQADYEREERESEEAIRANFEQARWRKLRRSPLGVSQNLQDPIRVLIVDDVADTRAHIRKLLHPQADIRVVGEARNGVEAIRQYEVLLPDVMTTCINMPDLDGISATEAIRRKHPTAKVVIISVQNAPNYVRRCAMAGACDYLTKPPLADELLSAIRLAAGRGTQQPTADGTTQGTKPVIGLDEVIRLWKDVRMAVKPAHPALDALLNSCKPMEVRGDVLLLGFQSETVRRLMDSPQNLELARRAIVDVLGVTLDIQCVLRRQPFPSFRTKPTKNTGTDDS